MAKTSSVLQGGRSRVRAHGGGFSLEHPKEGVDRTDYPDLEIPVSEPESEGRTVSSGGFFELVFIGAWRDIAAFCFDLMGDTLNHGF